MLPFLEQKHKNSQLDPKKICLILSRMYKITKILDSFSAAHRLIKGYQGPCRNLHGHTYKAVVTLSAPTLNHYDFLVDFKEIMNLFNEWVQNHLDHTTLVSDADIPLIKFLEKEKQSAYIIDKGANTTVETLACHLFHQFSAQLETYNQTQQSSIELTEVTVFESETSSATYTVAR